ncbi:protein of unknown function [Streptomyces sp. KY70]|nr:protein of unknown function [Streptomyces sp. KY70]
MHCVRVHMSHLTGGGGVPWSGCARARSGRPGDDGSEGRICHLVRLLAAPLHKPPCLQQSCPVPHKYHRRTTCNPRTPGISRSVRSLQRFVDMPTERQVKHAGTQLVPSEPHFTPTEQERHDDMTKARIP